MSEQLDVPVAYANAASVADLLRLALVERGWDHRQLHGALTADLLRHGAEPPSRTLVWQWLRGDRGVAADHLQAVARVFGWSLGLQLVATRIAAQGRAARRSSRAARGAVG